MTEVYINYKSTVIIIIILITICFSFVILGIIYKYICINICSDNCSSYKCPPLGIDCSIPPLYNKYDHKTYMLISNFTSPVISSFDIVVYISNNLVSTHSYKHITFDLLKSNLIVRHYTSDSNLDQINSNDFVDYQIKDQLSIHTIDSSIATNTIIASDYYNCFSSFGITTLSFNGPSLDNSQTVIPFKFKMID